MPPPPGHYSFAGLVAFVMASPNTVRSVVEHLKIEPQRPGGNVTWYSLEQAERIKAHYERHGGYYRANEAKRKSTRREHSGATSKN